MSLYTVAQKYIFDQNPRSHQTRIPIRPTTSQADRKGSALHVAPVGLEEAHPLSFGCKTVLQAKLAHIVLKAGQGFNA